MWTPQGCISVEAPCESTFLIQNIKWTQDGNSLVLIGKDQFCLTYLQLEAPSNDAQLKNGRDIDDGLALAN